VQEFETSLNNMVRPHKEGEKEERGRMKERREEGKEEREEKALAAEELSEGDDMFEDFQNVWFVGMEG
jgi:hypothetical protein